MEITDLLISTVRSGASDLHLSVTNPPIMRVHGEMLPINAPVLTPEVLQGMIYSVMTEFQRAEYERECEIDFSISFGDEMRFRVNAFNSINGPCAVFRTIPTRVLTLEELDAPNVLYHLCNLHKGLILVTGPTGSGKSTTLAAMVNHINTHHARHILTVEDPVEFIHQSKRSLINQREIGSSTKSFTRALKSALREDPDVILVGELRDLETIHLAMTAAETGHLVMGTLHTNSAPKTIDRIIDVFPANDKEMVRAMLSVSLEAIISQTLIKKKDGAGRVAAHEILLGTSAIRNLIREGKIPQISSMMQMGAKMGMCTMRDSIMRLAQDGAISDETAKDLLMTGDDETNANNARKPMAAPAAPQQASLPSTQQAEPF